MSICLYIVFICTGTSVTLLETDFRSSSSFLMWLISFLLRKYSHWKQVFIYVGHSLFCILVYMFCLQKCFVLTCFFSLAVTEAAWIFISKFVPNSQFISFESVVIVIYRLNLPFLNFMSSWSLSSWLISTDTSCFTRRAKPSVFFNFSSSSISS